MKKYLLYTMLFATAILSGCDKEEDPIFDDPDSRLIAALNSYESALVDAPNGWKATIYPAGGKGFTYYFDFDADGSVNMLSDFNSTTAGTMKKSTFRLKALQRPTLIFDTYSYIHLPADPTASISTGTTGAGLKSDFQFAFVEVNGDMIKLEGTANKNQMVLEKVTETEAASFRGGNLRQVMTESATYLTRNPYVFLQFEDGIRVQASLNATTKLFSLIYVENNAVQSSSSLYSYTTTGIRLQKPLNYKGKVIQELFWESTNSMFYVNVDGKRTNVSVSATPIVPMHLLLGIDFNVITVLEAATMPGWSADFTARRSTVAAATLASSFRLRLGNMAFTFNTQTRTMNIVVSIFQNATPFVATFPYTYTKTADGKFDFEPQSPIGNAALILNEMKPITEPISNETFRLEYFTDPTRGVVGQFVSIERPEFFFAGPMSK